MVIVTYIIYTMQQQGCKNDQSKVIIRLTFMQIYHKIVLTIRNA